MGTKSLIKKIRLMGITLLAASVMTLSPAYALDFGDTGQEADRQISSVQETGSDVSVESDTDSISASKNSLTVSAPGIMESGWGRYDGMTVLKGYGDYTIRLPETIYLGQQGGGNFVGSGGYEVDTDDGQKVNVTVQKGNGGYLESEGTRKEMSYEQDPFTITTMGPGEEGRSHTVSNNVLVKGTDLSKGTWSGTLDYNVHIQNRHALMFYYTGPLDGGGMQNMSAGPIYVYHGETVKDEDVPRTTEAIRVEGKDLLGPLWVNINDPSDNEATGYTSEQIKSSPIMKDMSFVSTWYPKKITVNIHHMYGPSTRWQRNGPDYNDADEYITTKSVVWNGETIVNSSGEESYTPGTQTMKWPDDVIRTGYTLKGLYRDKALTDEYHCGVDVLDILNPVVNLYCKWEPLNYTATYNLNDSLNPKAKYPASPALKTQFTVEDTFTLPQPTRRDTNDRGYTFKGWTGSNGTSAQKTVTVPKGTYKNLSYTANWTPDKISVNYDMNYNDKTNQVKTIAVDYNSLVKDNCTPSEAGYVFQGWYSAKTGGNKVSDTRVTAPMTVYAHWTPAQYTVTFKINLGGSQTGYTGYGANIGDSSKTAAYKSSITAPQPTRSYHTFRGWYTSPTYGQGTKIAGSSLKVPLNGATYYAQWTANNVNVTFNANGGSGTTTKTVAVGSSVTTPSPSWSNHTALGWYTGSGSSTCVTGNGSSMKITAPATYYQHWKHQVSSSKTVKDSSVTVYGKTWTGNSWGNSGSKTISSSEDGGTWGLVYGSDKGFDGTNKPKRNTDGNNIDGLAYKKSGDTVTLYNRNEYRSIYWKKGSWPDTSSYDGIIIAAKNPTTSNEATFSWPTHQESVSTWVFDNGN